VARLTQVANPGWLRPPLIYSTLLATLVLAAALVSRVVVRREERYLEGRFGRQYSSYRESVRRWL